MEDVFRLWLNRHGGHSFDPWFRRALTPLPTLAWLMELIF
jgi:hypothetical protein